MADIPFSQIILDAVTTGSGALAPATLNRKREHAFYVVGSSGVSAGAVQIETAPDENYAGTWAALGSAITVGDGTAQIVQVTGALLAARARVSTNIVGGTVTVTYVGS